ncbi:MAG: tRNA uridine-5-carboxymethylaminomethyl(34) synthesis GTPase MnmE [Oscillospiraceae bacterium]
MEPIAAIATALAPSAIGILRVSGEGAAAIAGRVFSANNQKPLGEQPPRSLVLGGFSDCTGGVIDHGLAVWFPAGGSYTGEESAELYCHGAPILLTALLSSLLAAGARQAGPGEFTRRAFLSGRMDLTQAEAVADLLDADNLEAAQNAAAQEGGSLRRATQAVYDGLVAITARFYAVVDYPDEDIEDLDRATIEATLLDCEERLNALLATCHRGSILKHGLPTALIGKPNVGKSSLLNALLGIDRVIVTDCPGTTRDTVEEKLNLGGHTLRLTDTAGIRETADAAEACGVDRARSAAAAAELALLVINGSAPLTAEDEAAIEAAGQAKKTLTLLNFADLPPDAATCARFPRGIPVSAKTGRGLADLETAIGALFPSGDDTPPGGILTNTRQADAATRARDAIRRARAGLGAGLTPDAVLTDGEEALAALGELTGRTAREDIVSEIFSHFCVGK